MQLSGKVGNPGHEVLEAPILEMDAPFEKSTGSRVWIASRSWRKIDVPMNETIVSLSLPRDVRTRLERYQEYLRRLNPALPITSGVAIRALICRALTEFEQEDPPDPDRERRLMRLENVPYSKR